MTREDYFNQFKQTVINLLKETDQFYSNDILLIEEAADYYATGMVLRDKAFSPEVIDWTEQKEMLSLSLRYRRSADEVLHKNLNISPKARSSMIVSTTDDEMSLQDLAQAISAA